MSTTLRELLAESQSTCTMPRIAPRGQSPTLLLPWNISCRPPTLKCSQAVSRQEPCCRGSPRNRRHRTLRTKPLKCDSLHFDMATTTRPRMHARSPTFPLYHSTRQKPRRWPLVLRFIKGAIHVDIALPVILHAAWSALVVYIDQVRDDHIGLPNSIIPSLSIVVGLMLVFRNQTSYDRFWQVSCSLARALLLGRC